MKKLNKKGFTLIELLAVIVILAIIVVVTVPTILNSINDARLSSIHSLSKEVANWYENGEAQDLLTTDVDKKILKGIKVTDNWKCLVEAAVTVGTGDSAVTYNLFDLYGLSSTDVVKDGAVSGIPNDIPESGMSVTGICSAIRKYNGRIEVLLVANKDGKFNTNSYTYAYSQNKNGSEGKASS